MTQRKTQCERPTQKDRVRDLLLKNRGQFVTTPQLLTLRIVDYRRRIFELREEGWLIETMPETWKGGQRISGYKLTGKLGKQKQLGEDTAMFSEYPAETV